MHMLHEQVHEATERFDGNGTLIVGTMLGNTNRAKEPEFR
jgi:hypothetical protein